MSISPATLRQRAAAALEALSGWHEIAVPLSAFDPSRIPEDYHLGFAVEVGSTTVMPSRQTPSVGVLVKTTIQARFGFLLRAEDAVASRDSAVAEELLAAAAVRAMTSTDAQPPVLSAVRRSTVPQSKPTHVITDMEWSILHLYPLQ